MAANRRVRLALRAKKNKVPHFIPVLQALYTGLKNHPGLYVNLPLDLAIFLAQITNLVTLQQAVKGGPKGSAALRDEARDLCATSADTYLVYVQSLCNASPEQAQTLAQSASLQIIPYTTPHKPVLGITRGPGSGDVILRANASVLAPGKGAKFFDWAYSLNGKDWLEIPSTNKATTTFSGLPALTVVSFRVRATQTKTGTGEWSQVVTFSVT